MGRGPNARRGHVDLSRIALGVGDKLGNRLWWCRGVYEYYERYSTEPRDWRDIANEIEIELVVKRCIDCACWCNREERITVRGRSDDHLSGDVSAATRPVLNYELRTE